MEEGSAGPHRAAGQHEEAAGLTCMESARGNLVVLDVFFGFVVGALGYLETNEGQYTARRPDPISLTVNFFVTRISM